MCAIQWVALVFDIGTDGVSTAQRGDGELIMENAILYLSLDAALLRIDIAVSVLNENVTFVICSKQQLIARIISNSASQFCR